MLRAILFPKPEEDIFIKKVLHFNIYFTIGIFIEYFVIVGFMVHYNYSDKLIFYKFIDAIIYVIIFFKKSNII